MKHNRLQVPFAM